MRKKTFAWKIGVGCVRKWIMFAQDDFKTLTKPFAMKGQRSCFLWWVVKDKKMKHKLGINWLIQIQMATKWLQSSVHENIRIEIFLFIRLILIPTKKINAKALFDIKWPIIFTQRLITQIG